MQKNTIVPMTAFVVAAATAAASAQLTLLEVGQGLSEGISDNGVVCGSFGPPEYFVWSEADGWRLIGGVPAGGGIGGQAKISADGTRVCGTVFNGTSGFHEMAFYDTGADAWTPLGGIGDPCSAEISSGWGMSGDGLNVVGLGWLTCGDAHATQWTNGVGVFDLGSTVPDNSSRASAVNFDGSVVAGWQDGAGRQGAVWVNGVQELIFDGSGGGAEEAFAVSTSGEFVTGFGIGPRSGVGRTYRYNTTTNVHESIPNLVVGEARFMAGTGITADGKTIVGGTWGFGPATFGNAYIWREGIGTMSLPDYLDELGVAYDPDLHFSFVSAISSDGQWMTGWGDIGGPANAVTWILHVPGACDPESGDVTGDGCVNFGDILEILGNWSATGDPGLPGDANCDGLVSFADIVLVLGTWGDGCP